MRTNVPAALALALASALAACGGGGTTADALTVLELGFYWTPGTTPCVAPTNIHLHFRLEGTRSGDAFMVSMTGPALPATLEEALPANLTVDKDFPIPKGSGVWDAKVLSVAGRTPGTLPGGHLEQQSSACCGP